MDEYLDLAGPCHHQLLEPGPSTSQHAAERAALQQVHTVFTSSRSEEASLGRATALVYL